MGTYLRGLVAFERGANLPGHEAGKDMKHYLIVARSMFDNGIYFSTFSNNQLDLEKTPLLYWPLVGIWHLFGISSLGHYIYTFTIGWINLFLSWWLAKQISPQDSKTPWLCLLVLILNLMWPSFYHDLRFEGLVTLFGLLFLNFSIKTLTSKNKLYWIFASLAFGFCIFAKGPIGFIYFLPYAMVLPYLSQRWGSSQSKAMVYQNNVSSFDRIIDSRHVAGLYV